MSIYYFIERILRRQWNRKYQESFSSPRQHVHCQNLSDVITLELGSLLKTCNFQGESLENKLQLVSGNYSLSSAVATHFPPQPCSSNLAHIPAAAGTHLVGDKVGNKDPIFQISGICILITECCFWSWKCRHRDR